MKHNMKFYKSYKFNTEHEFLLKNKASAYRDVTYYMNSICTLDTETSHNHDLDNPKAWIYLWAINVDNQTVYGRTADELIDCLKTMKEAFNLDNNYKLPIFIHNSSYDLAYLMDFLRETFNIESEKVLALKTHSFISYEIDSFIFFCTYKLTNKSLDKWSKDLKTKHKKLIGNLDYDKIYYPFSVLSEEILCYMENDVVVLKECIEITLKMNNDTLVTLPLTSTGYPRRDVRNSYKKDKKAFFYFSQSKQSLKTYKDLTVAFMGGYTHGNRWYKNELIKESIIRHFDFRSHYPSVLTTQKYPMGKFQNVYKENLTIEEILKTKESKASIIEIIIKNPQIYKGVTMPILSRDKATLGFHDFKNEILDNGRVLKFEGFATLILTELDLDLLNEQYNFDYVIVGLKQTKKEFLPKWITTVILKYFEQKTVYKQELQKLEEGTDEYINKAIELLVSKQKLNSIYGMTASKIIRDIIKCDEYGNWSETIPEDEQEIIDIYYNNRKNFCRFEWGVWCTAYARFILFSFIKLIGYEKCIYCDTDSIFFFSTDEVINKIEKRNEEDRKKALTLGAYIEDIKGEKINFQCFESETCINHYTGKKEYEEIKEFKFLHAKAYMIKRKNDDSVSLTLAGVTSRSRDFLNDGITREMECLGITTRKNEKGELIYKLGNFETKDSHEILNKGNIDNLREGMTFTLCGGSSIEYSKSHEIKTETINGKSFRYAGFAIIREVEKEIKESTDDFFEGLFTKERKIK